MFSTPFKQWFYVIFRTNHYYYLFYVQVKTREGHFIPATPIEGSVLINVGDTMQRWTADRLVSTVKPHTH